MKSDIQDPSGYPGVDAPRTVTPTLPRRLNGSKKDKAHPIPSFIVVLDIRTNSLYSSSLGLFSDVPRGGLPQAGIPSLIPLDRLKIQLLIRQTIRTGQSQKQEFRLHTAGGGTRVVESETGMVLDEHGNLSKVIVTTLDITSRRGDGVAPDIGQSERG